MEWIKLEEKHPDFDVPVLVYGEYETSIAKLNTVSRSAIGVSFYFIEVTPCMTQALEITPTHWMPLPEPPNQKKLKRNTMTELVKNPLTSGQLFKEAQGKQYVIMTDKYGEDIGFNCRVSKIAIRVRPFNRKKKTRIVAVRECSFHEYISKKYPLYV